MNYIWNLLVKNLCICVIVRQWEISSTHEGPKNFLKWALEPFLHILMTRIDNHKEVVNHKRKREEEKVETDNEDLVRFFTLFLFDFHV